MSSCSPARAVLACFTEVAKALAHAHRLELLEHLGQGERSVEKLSAVADLSVANASQHLQQLRRAGLVATRRDGKRVLYRLTDDGVVDLLTALRRAAERNVGAMERLLKSYFRTHDELEPVSREDLVKRLRSGGVTLLDVRPEDEFVLGHLPGALNIPLPELERRLADLPADHDIVAYCRGPYCVLSFEAVAALRARGFRVRRLEDGYPEWKAAGFPVDGTRSAA
jgi:rhodanese-related sulfurtransferase/DNA-binding transcriptional ArsR family regulator